MATSRADCPFCEIARREDPDAREVFRDDAVVAFFPTEPATLGHTLLIPKDHIENIWALDSMTAERIGAATVALANAVKRALEPDGLNVIQSNGQAATQSVPHLHVHIVPRWEDDRIGPIWPPETAYTEREKDDAWAALRAECRKLMAD